MVGVAHRRQSRCEIIDKACSTINIKIVGSTSIRRVLNVYHKLPRKKKKKISNHFHLIDIEISMHFPNFDLSKIIWNAKIVNYLIKELPVTHVKCSARKTIGVINQMLWMLFSICSKYRPNQKQNHIRECKIRRIHNDK